MDLLSFINPQMTFVSNKLWIGKEQNYWAAESVPI